MFIEKVKKRKLSLIGIFFILLALDFLTTSEIIIYDVSPMIGEIFPFIKIEKPTKTLPTFIVKLYSWPFYVPMLIGGTLIAIDVGKIKKEKEEGELTEGAVKW